MVNRYLSVRRLGWNPICYFLAVRHIIRNIKTGGYFRGGTWVSGRDDAEDFKDTQRVIAASIKYQLENIEMILQLGDKPCAEKDVVVRIGAWWRGWPGDEKTAHSREVSWTRK